ncbi:MAG TPA: Crp/Fnr family transcriptional regulator, partial [Thermoanaerobaculia bacterium]|nr:Crp/Fnr family transcriptional regulator [Thermoanaerobaculia bacterium]
MASQHGRAHAPARLLRDVFQRDSLSLRRVEINPEEYVYNTGDVDDAMYLIEAGQVKVFMSSAGGQDCLLAIHTAGDVFGESCFAGSKRFEIAQAMEPTIVLRALRRDFVAEVRRAEMMDALLRHLGARIAERQIAAFDLATMDSERRLAKVLLHLSEKLGVAEGAWQRIDQISQ